MTTDASKPMTKFPAQIILADFPGSDDKTLQVCIVEIHDNGYAYIRPAQAYDLRSYNSVPEVLGNWVNSRAEEPHEPALTAQRLADLLLLVRDEIPGGMPGIGTIQAWDQSTRGATAAWARAVHLSASDNDDVIIPPVPRWLR